MFELNIKNTIVPLINNNWDKSNKDILNKLKEILLDSIYFKCYNKISSTYCEQIVHDIIPTLEYKSYSKNEILLNYNEPVNKYYFIFKGKLNVYKVNMEKAENNLVLISHENHYDKEEVLQYFNTYLKKYLKSINTENIFINNFKSIYNIEEEIEETKNKRARRFEKLYKNIINNSKEFNYCLNEGKIFGEEFLYNNMPLSNCILECGSDCVIGELKREDYEKIYKKFNKFERSFTTVFLINMKLFDSANYFFSKLQQCLIKRYFSKNEIIFNQGDKFHAFYLIRNGKINLSLKIQKTVNCFLEPDLIMGNLKKERFTSNKTYITRGKYSENIDYNLITLQSGEFIGEIEYYEKNNKYLYTAQSTEDCILYEFDIDLFEHFIVNNYNVNNNLKGFYKKIKEKMILLQERIYSIKMNNSAIKKTDYILSKNKFTRNILLGHPIKEEKKVNTKLSNDNINTNSNRNKKINKNENFYLNMISPFLKRYSSASKKKKFSKIKFNDIFFNDKSKKKIYLNKNIVYKLKDISSVEKSNISNRLLTEMNEAQSTNRTQNNNIKIIIDRNNSEIKNNNYLLSLKSLKTSNIINNNNNTFRTKKSSKYFINSKYIKSVSENEKLYDFMDANLIFSRNDKNRNIIPKILKCTKESEIYKQRYDKETILKINNYYFKSPKSKKQ